MPVSGNAAATVHRPCPGARRARADLRSSQHAGRFPHAGRRASEARGHGSQREIRRVAITNLVPGERRRDTCIGRRPYRVRGGDGTILGVLVVIDEHTVALLLPPLAGGERRCAPLDFTRECERGAAHFVKVPARFERTQMCMPREPDVFGHPTRLKSSRTARDTAVTSWTCFHVTPGNGSRSTRSSSGCSRSSARTGCGCSSRQARFASQASAAASRGTISSATRPDGKRSSTTSIQPGRLLGARF